MAPATPSTRGQSSRAAWRSANFLPQILSAALLGSCGGGGDSGSSGGKSSVTLAWDPVVNANIVGYRIYYGTSTGTYTQPPRNGLDAGNVTTYTLQGLSGGRRYYFVATAFDATGQESDYSNEVFKDMP